MLCSHQCSQAKHVVFSLSLLEKEKKKNLEKGRKAHSKLRTCCPLVDSCGANDVRPGLSAFYFPREEMVLSGQLD